MAWVEKNHNDHRVSTPLPWAGLPTTRPGCPEPHPAWPSMPPGMGYFSVLEMEDALAHLKLFGPSPLNSVWILHLKLALGKRAAVPTFAFNLYVTKNSRLVVTDLCSLCCSWQEKREAIQLIHDHFQLCYLNFKIHLKHFTCHWDRCSTTDQKHCADAEIPIILGVPLASFCVSVVCALQSLTSLSLSDLWVSLVSWNWVLFACSQFPFLPLSSKESSLKCFLWTLSRSPEGWYRKQWVSFLYKLLGCSHNSLEFICTRQPAIGQKLMNCQGIRQNTINTSERRACNKKESSSYIAPFIPKHNTRVAKHFPFYPCVSNYFTSWPRFNH